MCDNIELQETPKPEPIKEEFNPESTLLIPNHHLLEKFQKTLKEHLESLINNTKKEVYEVEVELRKKNAELETVGLKVYQQQQFVCNKQETLVDLIKSTEILREKHKKEEEDLKENTERLKEINDKLFITKKDTREISNELNALQELNASLEDVDKHIQGHLKVNQTIASKRRVDKENLSKEKQKQDFLLHSLDKDVRKLENEIETLDLTIQAKQVYIDEMEKKIAEGSTTISALETEYKCLLMSWNAAVVAIGHRDDKLNCAKNKLKVLTSKLTKVSNETDIVKKEMKQCLAENEKLTYFRNSVLRNYEKNKQTYKQDIDKKNELLQDMMQLENIITETNKEAKNIKEMNKYNQNRYDETEQICQKKISIEREIQSILLKQTSSESLHKHLDMKLLKAIQKRNESELICRRILNRKSTVDTEVAEQKLVNEELLNQLEEINRDNAALTVEADQLKKQTDNQEFIYRKNKTAYKIINDKLLKRLASKETTPPHDLRIQELERMITDTDSIIKNLQKVWINEQNNIIKLSKERQEQIKLLYITRKKVLMSEQQILTVEDNLQRIQREEKETEMNIQREVIKSKKLSEEIFNKRNRKQKLDKDNIFYKNKYEETLRHEELELLKFESEIAEIEEDKLTLSKDLIECNREALAWEEKYKIARDFLKDSMQERNQGGEVNIMKTKLGQGRVILGELKKNQERILRELQISMSNRDSLFYKSQAQQRIKNKYKNNQGDMRRKNVVRKIADIKNQIKRTMDEIQTKKKEINMLDEHKILKNNDLTKIVHSLKVSHEFKPFIESQLEEIKTNKQIKLELLVYRQRKAEMYRMLAKDRKPFRRIKNDELLVTEYEKQKEISNKLRHIITELQKTNQISHQELVRSFHILSVLYVT